MTAEAIDRYLAIAAFALPVVAVMVIRNRFLAIFLGTISAWLILDASSDWIAKFDPDYEPNSLSNTIWTGLGWIPALIYTSLLCAAKGRIKVIRKKQNEK